MMTRMKYRVELLSPSVFYFEGLLGNNGAEFLLLSSLPRILVGGGCGADGNDNDDVVDDDDDDDMISK